MKLRVLLMSLVVVSIFLVSGILAAPRVYAFANGENASVVLGFTNFTSRNNTQPPTGATLAGPAGLTFDSSGNLWIADASNGRVLEFKPPFTTGESASTVLGAPDFVTSTGFSSSTSQTSLPEPYGLAFDSSGNLWVSDGLAHRIVEFKAPFSNGESESLVLGAQNFTGGSSSDIVPTQSDLNSPRGMAFDSSGNLWVADAVWNRVVEFKAPLTMGESESAVIGQTNFTSQYNISGCPHSCSAAMTQGALGEPISVAFDSSGNLWVADSADGRVLRYVSPISTGENPNLAIGSANYVSHPFCTDPFATAFCLDFPDYLAFDKSGNLWVNDDTNGRVLEFPQPFSMNESATAVIGQPNLTTAAAVAGQFIATQSNIYGNDGIALDSSGNLWVSDGLNNRVMEFPASTVGNTSTTSANSASTSSSATASSTISTSLSVPPTSASLSVSQTPTTSATSSVVVPPPTTAATSTSSSSSTSISLNYLLVVAVVGIVMVGTLAIFRRRIDR